METKEQIIEEFEGRINRLVTITDIRDLPQWTDDDVSAAHILITQYRKITSDVSGFDRLAIGDDLIAAFIAYQYRLDNPMPSHAETPAAMKQRYLDDSLFHAKVENLVSGVMNILNKHLF